MKFEVLEKLNAFKENAVTIGLKPSFIGDSVDPSPENVFNKALKKAVENKPQDMAKYSIQVEATFTEEHSDTGTAKKGFFKTEIFNDETINDLINDIVKKIRRAVSLHLG